MDNELRKSIYKSILKGIRSKQKEITDKVVEDILDPNDVAQVDPDDESDADLVHE